MKSYLLRGFGFLLAVGLVSSCTNLSKHIYSVVPNQNFWQTPDQVAAGIAPAYQALTNIPDGNVMNLNEITSDEMIVPTRGSDWYDNDQWQQMWLHTWPANHSVVNGAWGDLYNGIGKINFTLSIVNNLNPKPADIASINAELKLLRAYYYFMAMDMFGNIPVVTDFNTNPDSVTNMPRAQVFSFIETEIKNNIENMPSTLDASYYGRMTKWGAFSLLAKLYLNAQVYTGTPRWSDCISACDSVILSGNYSLDPNYFDNFGINNQGSPENIFVVPFDKINIGGMNWEMQTLHYQSQLTYNLSGSPWNGFCTTADFYNQFQNGDSRKKQWLVGQQYDASGKALTDLQTGLPLIFSPYVDQLSNPADSFRLAGARNVKYAPESGTSGNQSNDMVIFRYADVLLMKAECELRLNTNLGDAVNLVNMVRERAFGNATQDWTLADLTLDNLLAERGRELAWEGWRRQDLIRFGHFGDARNPSKAPDPDNHLDIFPIPAQQISSNPNLKQNPGY